MTHLLTKIGSSLALAAACSLFSVSLAADEEKDPPAAPVPTGSLDEQMLGYWAPDTDAMMARLKKELPEGQDAQAIIPMIQAMLAKMAAEVTKTEVIIHAMGQPQKTTYKVTKTDPATKTLTMEVTDQKGVTEEGTATIEGSKLTLSKEGESIVFNRITKDEFEKRKATAPTIPGLPDLEE